MSIKKHGGVFGRNPKFNDVELEGGLIVEGSIDAGGAFSLSGDVVIGGNLTVNGDVTQQNVTEWSVEDPNITIGSGITTDAAADGGGITLKGATDKTITWVESSGAWTFNTPVETGYLRLDSSTISSATGAVVLPEVDVNNGTIDGTTIDTSDITIPSGNTLDVSAGTLTLANDQISGDKVEGGTINAITINTLTNTTTNAVDINATGTITGDLTGDVTGNLTGNVTGDVTGDVTGNVTGDLTGDVTGNLTGNVTGDVTGDLTGNADTATALKTARDFSISGDVTASSVSFDGTAAVILSATVVDDSHNHTLSTITDSGTIASQDANNVTVSGGTIDGTTIGATTPDSAAFTTASASGGFTGDLTGNADTASALETARTIALSGDVTGSTSFDGSGNVTISTALDGGNADTLDGEQGTYYLDHNNFTNVPDPTLTLSGDVTGSATFTDLGNATLTTTVGDDSHNHTLSTITDSGTIASQDAGSVSITGGTIDDTAIGGTTPNLGTFTDLEADEIRVDDGLVDAPTITFRNDPDTGIFRPQDGTLGFTANGVGVFTTADAAGSDFVVLGTIDTYELKLDKSVVASGTTGDQTINKTAGAVNFADGATSLTVTNSYVDADSIIIATVATNDGTMTSAQVVAGAGSFVIYPNAAPTEETRVNFLVVN